MQKAPHSNLKYGAIQKKLLIGFMDVVSIVFAFFFALWLRYEFRFSDIPAEYLNTYAMYI